MQTTKTSVHGAINMLGLAKRLKAKILQASTSEVYGDPAVHPQTEDPIWGNVNPIGPRSCYDEGKRCAETLFFDYHRQHELAIKVARIFNTYGPRMHPADGRVVSNFIVQALRGEAITLYGDGNQTRSFCYVDDLVGGLIASDGNRAGSDRAGQSRQSRRIHHPPTRRIVPGENRVEDRNWSCGRCHRTIRASVVPISAWRNRCSAGSRGGAKRGARPDGRLFQDFAGRGMTAILGINAFHADSAACLVIDGKLVGAVAEERLGERLKHSPKFPENAIRWLLADNGMKLSDITHVAMARDTSANRSAKISWVLANPSKGIGAALEHFSRSGKTAGLATKLARIVDADPATAKFLDRQR